MTVWNPKFPSEGRNQQHEDVAKSVNTYCLFVFVSAGRTNRSFTSSSPSHNYLSNEWLSKRGVCNTGRSKTTPDSCSIPPLSGRYSVLTVPTTAGKSRRIAGSYFFSFFLSGLNVHLHNDRELSWRPTEQCLRIELEGDSALWDQLFSSISESTMWGGPGSWAQVDTALPLPSRWNSQLETPHLPPAPLGVARRKAMDARFIAVALSDIWQWPKELNFYSLHVCSFMSRYETCWCNLQTLSEKYLFRTVATWSQLAQSAQKSENPTCVFNQRFDWNSCTQLQSVSGDEVAIKICSLSLFVRYPHIKVPWCLNI